MLQECDELEVMRLSSERGAAPDEAVLHGYAVTAHVRLRGRQAREMAGDLLLAIDDALYEGHAFRVEYAMRAFTTRSHDEFGGESPRPSELLGETRAAEIRRLARAALAAVTSENGRR